SVVPPGRFDVVDTSHPGNLAAQDVVEAPFQHPAHPDLYESPLYLPHAHGLGVAPANQVLVFPPGYRLTKLPSPFVISRSAPCLYMMKSSGPSLLIRPTRTSCGPL